MKYKIILKQIEILDVIASTEADALKQIKDQLDPRALVEMQIVEEVEIKENE